RMPHDHSAGACISQHFRRNIARVRTRSFGVTVLTANSHARTLRRGGKARDQGCGRTNYQIGFAGERFRPGYDLGELAARGSTPFLFQFPRAEWIFLARHKKPSCACVYQTRLVNARGLATSQSLFSCKELVDHYGAPALLELDRRGHPLNQSSKV